MDTNKISSLLRQIDQFKKAEYLNDHQKNAAIQTIKAQIDQITGQETLDLAYQAHKPAETAATAAGKVLKG